MALIALGISISLDELAIGLMIGLAHLPVAAGIGDGAERYPGRVSEPGGVQPADEGARL